MKKVRLQDIWQTFLTNSAILVCNVITGVLAARILQPEGRGALAAIILWPSILAGLGIMGTNWALSREVAAHPEKEADLARAAVMLGAVQAALFMALGYFLVPHLLPGDKQHLINLARIYLIFLPLNFVCDNLLALEQGGLRWKRYNFLRLTVVLPYLIFILCFWMFRVTQVAWFVMALLISNLVAMASRLYVQRAEIRRGLVRLKEALHILKKGFPFFLAAISGVAALQVDKAMVVSLLSSEAVGCYVAAFAFASTLDGLGGALGVTSFAALANPPLCGRWQHHGPVSPARNCTTVRSCLWPFGCSCGHPGAGHFLQCLGASSQRGPAGAGQYLSRHPRATGGGWSSGPGRLGLGAILWPQRLGLGRSVRLHGLSPGPSGCGPGSPAA
jgi:O-antigen/teichoic acid export membrane protein